MTTGATMNDDHANAAETPRRPDAGLTEAEAERLLGHPQRALAATARLVELAALRGDSFSDRWRELEAAGVVSPYTLADLVGEALEATPPDVSEARRLVARGDALLWAGWRAVLEHLGSLMDLLPDVDVPLAASRRGGESSASTPGSTPTDDISATGG